MKKYIDAEKLKAEIARQIVKIHDECKQLRKEQSILYGKISSLKSAFNCIDFRQQEQIPTEREIAEAHHYAEMIRERDKVRIQQEQPEVDLMDTRIQYASVHDGIKSFAETYSFNIDSQLFQQLSKEQQELWRKEIEQAVVSGGDIGITLARDVRYKENQSQPEVDLEEYIENEVKHYGLSLYEASYGTFSASQIDRIIRNAFELGLNARKEE